MEYPKFKVCCRCFTFNQAKYITDAMNGFCMQKTNFPFICCIVDDASTDGEQEVIEKYLEDNFDLSKESGFYKEETDYGFITYARHKTNDNCYFYVIFLKENHYSNPEIQEKKMSYISHWQCLCKYEAMCEGDDYWIDSSKLQKQADFLENNSDYIMCFTNFNIYIQNSGKMDHSVLTSQSERYPHEFTIEQWIMAKSYVGPMSWMYRTSCIYKIPELGGPDGTVVWFAYFIATSKVKCLLQDTSAVYRINNGGVTQVKHIRKVFDRVKGLRELQVKLAELFLKADTKSLLLSKLTEEYLNKNIKLIYLCGSNVDKKELIKSFNMLSFANKNLVFLYFVAGKILNYIYLKHKCKLGYLK